MGKSYIALMDQAPVQITLSADITVQEFLGMFVPSGSVFRWQDGPITTAMKTGSLLVLNEIGRASDAVKDVLLGVLDDPDVAILALPSGEKLKPAPGFRVIATANTPPDAEFLDPALRSRFEAEIHLNLPNPALVSRLNESVKGLGDAPQDSFADPDRALDPRKMLTLAHLVRNGVRPRHAAALAFGLRAPDVLAALSASGVRL